MKDNIYTVRVVCEGCLRWEDADVPKGIRVWDYLEGHPCPQCGCTKWINPWQIIKYSA